MSAACAPIARRLALSPARVIGVLPAADGVNLGPLLVRLALALAGFVKGKVGVIPRWSAWARAPGVPGEAGALPLRALGPRVVAIVPAACREPKAAALALQPVLWSLPEELGRVLVDLGGFAKPGALPGAGVLADGLVVAVPVRRARRADVAALQRAIPAGKALGAILIG